MKLLHSFDRRLLLYELISFSKSCAHLNSLPYNVPTCSRIGIFGAFCYFVTCLLNFAFYMYNYERSHEKKRSWLGFKKKHGQPGLHLNVHPHIVAFPYYNILLAILYSKPIIHIRTAISEQKDDNCNLFVIHCSTFMQ